MKYRALKSIILISLFYLLSINIIAQVPAVLDTGTLQEQLDYLQDKTNIYNNYRAVRNDMFLKLKSNVIDAEENSQIEISRLNKELEVSKATIDSLNSNLKNKTNELEEAIRTKNSFNLLGLKIDKVLYNSILWIIILALAGVTAIMFLMYKRSLVSTKTSKNELEEIKDEFEDYKKQSREKREKLVVKHHQEMMKLKKDMGI